MSNQGARQASVRAVTGTSLTYEGDWHALFDMAGIPVGTFNERMLAWINDYMGESFTELNGAMAAFAIDQGADSWNGLGTFDAAPFPPQVAGLRNKASQGRDSQALTDRYYFRFPDVVAHDTTNLNINLHNFYFTSSEQNVGNSWDVVAISLEMPGGTMVPVNFGGVRTTTVANGATDINSDGTGASASAGDIVWIKGVISVPAGQYVPWNTDVSDYAGSQAGWFNSAATSLSSVDVAGAFTNTGIAPNTRPVGLKPFLLGKPVDPNVKTIIMVGDSIPASQGDDYSNGIGSGGFFQRSLSNDTVTGDFMAGMNFSIGGITLSGYIGANTKWQNYIKYTKNSIIEAGTNDISFGANLATLQSREGSLVTILNNNGTDKIFRCTLIIRGTSSNSFVDAAGQTANSGYAAGQTMPLFNAWLDTKVSDDTYYAKVPTITAVQDTTNTALWGFNGTPNYLTADGAHPTPTGHELMADVTRPIIRS